MGRNSNTPEEFSTIDLDNNDTVNDIDMAQEFSSVRLSEDNDIADNTNDQVHSSASISHDTISHHPNELSMSSANDRTASMTADHLLDELSDATTTQHRSAPGTFPLEISRSTSSKTSNASIGNGTPSSPGVPEKDWTGNDNSRMTYQYDQFFEEVSLDLPRDTQQPFAATPANTTASMTTTSPTASKLLKFMPRRPTADQKPPNLSITTADVSGPFYSISDVLSDSPNTNATAAAAAAAAAAVAATSSSASTSNKDDPASQQRGARRNVYERDVIVTSGGSSARAIKRRSRQVDDLNPFSRKTTQQKPSPLETVVSKTRPRMLPPKNPNEEKKHLQQHQAMMKKARKLEAKKEKEVTRRKEEKDKMMAQAIHVWESDIITNWSSRINDAKTRELWLQGVPPRCRKRVWILAIGNDLKIAKDMFTNYTKRLPHPANGTEKTATNELMTQHQEGEWPSDAPNDNHAVPDELYNIRRVRRTSSLNVLHEDPSEKIDYPESIHEQSGRSSMQHSSDDLPREENDYPRSNRASRSAVELQNQHTTTSDDGEDVRISDDIDDSDTDNRTSSEYSADVPLDNTGISAYLVQAIDEDIVRTLPSLCVFQPDGPLFNSLRKILNAYVRSQDEPSYSRGTSFLAGMLLLNMNSQETFIALCNLIHKSDVLSALYNSDEQRVRGYFKIFNIVFAENLPKLYLHFKNLSLTPEHYLPDWFMTIFSSILPLDLSSRLWDIFLLEGDIILFKTGLAVLKYLEPLLWGGSFGETVKTLNMGFIGEERGQEVKAAVAVTGHIMEGEHDAFFNEVLGRNGLRLDRFKFKELVAAHVLAR